MKARLSIPLLMLLALPAAQACALEIFLNENRSETGTIGFVDIDRAFTAYSGTKNSKEEMRQEIQKKENAIEKKRKKIYEQKARAAKLRQERELAIILPEMLEARQKTDNAAEKLRQDSEKIRQDAETLEKQKKDLERQRAEAEKQQFIIESRQQGLPEDAIQAMIKEKFPQEGLSADTNESAVNTDTAAAFPGGISAGLPKNAKDSKKTELYSPGTGRELEAYESIPLPDLPLSPYGKEAEEAKNAPAYKLNVPGIGDFSFTVSTEPARIAEEIKNLEEKIKNGEAELADFEKQSEQELAEYEEASMRQLLGKIYTALKKLSEQEEISVVVDKRNILYGKKTVDLTEKLLSLLETPEEE